MRILFLSNSGDGAWHALVLMRAGHSVDWLIEDEKYSDVLKGIIPPAIESFDDPSQYGLIVFDDTKHGDAADELREHAPVIGNSKLADDLEHDRLFGLEFMEKCGISVPDYQPFDDIGKAVSWLSKHDTPTVFKPFGGTEDKSTTYVSSSSEDMIRYLEKLTAKAKIEEFILQDIVEGVEISTEGWFNGEEFLAVNHTLEEKRFMSGGIGPNTGCSGNVVWMPDRHTAVFREGLRRCEALLRASGFVGPIDLNTIVNEKGCHALEWTPRFGYEGTCNLMQLIPGDFGQFMYEVATGGRPTVEPAGLFAAAIRLSVPPYPNVSDPKKYQGIPVKGITPEDVETFYISDIMLNDDDEVVTLGTDGFIGAPIRVGKSIGEAVDDCYKKIETLQIPDLMYRCDIAKCCTKRYDALRRLGWLESADADVE